MISFWVDPWEVQDIWHADIFVNGDKIKTIGELASEREAMKVGEAFIDGIKYMRGNENE